MNKPDYFKYKEFLAQLEEWYTENIGDFDQNQAEVIDRLIEIAREYYTITYQRSERQFNFNEINEELSNIYIVLGETRDKYENQVEKNNKLINDNTELRNELTITTRQVYDLKMRLNKYERIQQRSQQQEYNKKVKHEIRKNKKMVRR